MGASKRTPAARNEVSERAMSGTAEWGAIDADVLEAADEHEEHEGEE
jgi:hypothetical protein